MTTSKPKPYQRGREGRGGARQIGDEACRQTEGTKRGESSRRTQHQTWHALSEKMDEGDPSSLHSLPFGDGLYKSRWFPCFLSLVCTSSQFQTNFKLSHSPFPACNGPRQPKKSFSRHFLLYYCRSSHVLLRVSMWESFAISVLPSMTFFVCSSPLHPFPGPSLH